LSYLSIGWMEGSPETNAGLTCKMGLKRWSSTHQWRS
jgi:hypothetical protein